MSDTLRGRVLIIESVKVMFEKPDHSRGVIKEQNVSSDVFEQYNYYGDVL